MARHHLNFEQPMKISSIEVNDFVTRVVATPKGIIAGILQLFGVGSKSHFQVDAEGARLKKCKFGSEEETFIPFAHISATFYRVAKPMWALIVGVFVFLGGVGATQESGGENTGLLIMGTSVLFFLLYLFGSRDIVLGIVSDAGTAEQIKLTANKDELQKLKEVKARIDEMVIGEKDLI